MKKSNIKKIIIFVVILVGGVYFVKNKLKLSQNLDNRRIYVVEKGDLLQRVTIAGNVMPQRKTFISAPYDGYIHKIYVQVSQLVKQGDPIVSISQSLQNSDNNYPLRSPIEGVVVHIKKSEGEHVRQSDSEDYIIRIDDLSKLYMEGDIPEVDRNKLKKGQEVLIKATAISQKSYKGILQDIAMASKVIERWGNSQILYPVKVKIVDADELLKPGMSIIGDIVTDKKESVLLVPHEYLYKDEEKYFVLLKSGEKKEVELGSSNNDFFEVQKGLKKGDELLPIDYTSLNLQNDETNKKNSKGKSLR